MKQVIAQIPAPGRHWVGDGFPVHGMFGYQQGALARSPFLMLDYAAPMDFPPNPGAQRRGVGSHPHRGFETVTIVYDGEVQHRDSAGGGGVIGPGDVQWMTAGRGLVHDEFHSDDYSARGGPFHMVQLWVNLPQKDKMTTPRYQAITDATIPRVTLPGGAGTARLIAGELAGQRGPAQTFTPMNVWDVQIAAGATVHLDQPDGWTALVLVQSGEVTAGDGAQARHAGPASLLQFSREGRTLALTAQSDARLLLMAGEPIAEPVVGYGPFVMNTQDEIVQAIQDFNSGHFGEIVETVTAGTPA
ncbi:pirin family protein [Amphibiibacter pelophylacis]|uniref:Pirin family protein n=1 Tax=Amphibiibacter pelophylacis TaxID=1799477 RepID=A0ACC6P1E2_9BURK